MSGFDPRFKTRLDALLNEAQGAGHSPKIVSGYRSPFDQRRAINHVANRLYGRPASFIEMARGIPGYAAAPGASKHQHGLAADIAKGPALDWMHANASRFGIGFPIKTDTVHAQFDPKFRDTIETNPTYNDNELGPDPNIGGGVVAPGTGQPATGGTAVAGMQSRPYLSVPVSGQAPGQTLQGMTPERVSMMRAQAMREGQDAGDTSPVGHWSAALARALGGLNSAVGMNQANAGEMQGQQAVANALMSGGDMASTGRALASTPYGAKMGQQMLLADMQQRAKLEAQRNDPMLKTKLELEKAKLERAQFEAATNKELKPLQVDAARVGLDTARARLEALKSKANNPNVIADPEKRAQVEAGLRKELTARTSDYRVLRDAARSINAVAKNPSPAGDLSLIFSYMKVLDPTSVVRESEQAMATNAAGVPERIRNLYNRLLIGESLSPKMRNDYISKAQTLANQKRRSFEADIRDYSAISRRFGLDPRNIAIGTDPIEPPKSGAGNDLDPLGILKK